MTFKFKAGQRVVVGAAKLLTAPKGRYRVVGALPNSGGRAQYRIKSEIEPYERVVDEATLEAEELPDWA
jgi:hypothetical protein